jgi:hypothetical protein
MARPPGLWVEKGVGAIFAYYFILNRAGQYNQTAAGRMARVGWQDGRHASREQIRKMSINYKV